ncbi:MAG: aquaporin [Planctomycetota bacterium]
MSSAKYLTEFIGTFFLVFIIVLAVTNSGDNVGIWAPLAIGSGLMVLVYMGGHVSGAHYNPAVTLALLMRGACKAKDVVPYWIAQIGGAIAGAFVVSLIVPEAAEGADAVTRYFGPAPGEGYSITSPGPWMIEILFTFLLVIVVLNVATSSGTTGNSYYGLAIGFVVLVGAYVGGSISGGAFNPAVGIGPNLIKGTLGGEPEAMSNMVLHIVGPVVGAVLATGVFKMQESFVDSQAKS